MVDQPSAPFVLASGSPRRVAILKDAGFTFTVAPAGVEEPPIRPNVKPTEYAQELALAKAAAVSGRMQGAVVLGADTVVVLDGEVLGKPRDADEAVAMLGRLNDRQHEVLTGVAVAGAAGNHHDVQATRVTFRRYSEAEMASYVAGGSPMDKAGAYGIQDAEFAPVRRIEGCYLNVVGLPLCLVRKMLSNAGVPVPEGAP